MGTAHSFFRRLIHRYVYDRRNGSVSGLPHSKDRCQITLLLEQFPLVDRKTRTRIETALIHLLPGIESEQSSQFTRTHMATLYRCLQLKTANRNPDFVIAVLKALEVLGDNEAPLTRIASLAFAHPTFVHDTRVSDAAGRCHAVLEARRYHMQATEKLLRAADSPSQIPDFLLYPARDASEAEPARLMRPTMEE